MAGGDVTDEVKDLINEIDWGTKDIEKDIEIEKVLEEARETKVSAQKHLEIMGNNQETIGAQEESNNNLLATEINLNLNNAFKYIKTPQAQEALKIAAKKDPRFIFDNVHKIQYEPYLLDVLKIAATKNPKAASSFISLHEHSYSPNIIQEIKTIIQSKNK